MITNVIQVETATVPLKNVAVEKTTNISNSSMSLNGQMLYIVTCQFQDLTSKDLLRFYISVDLQTAVFLKLSPGNADFSIFWFLFRNSTAIVE